MHWQWTHWVPSHHGPMIHYMANANGAHKDIDKFKLKWNKIDELGLIDPDHSWNMSAKQPGGYWAADRLIMQGDRYDFQIPASIAKGNYVIRAETIAVHDAMIKDGIQHYPQCINIEVTEGGSDQLLGGVIGTELYSPTDPGISNFDVFSTKPLYTNYPIPGPPIHQCGQKGYDETPHPGSAPVWHGPDSAESYGADSKNNRVGPIGVPPPDGPTYGNDSPQNNGPATTGSTITPTSMTSASPNSVVTSAGPVAATTPAISHSSFASHIYAMSGNASATAAVNNPTGTASPTVIANPGGNTPVTYANSNSGSSVNQPSPSPSPSSGSSSGTTPIEHTYSSNTPGGTDSGSKNAASDTSSGGNQPNSQSGDHTNSCPTPGPAPVDSATTPTDDSTVAQLLDIIDACVQKLRGKVGSKLRRHARDVLRRGIPNLVWSILCLSPPRPPPGCWTFRSFG